MERKPFIQMPGRKAVSKGVPRTGVQSTTSNKADQSFAVIHSDTRLHSVQSISAVNDTPIAIVSL